MAVRRTGAAANVEARNATAGVSMASASGISAAPSTTGGTASSIPPPRSTTRVTSTTVRVSLTIPNSSSTTALRPTAQPSSTLHSRPAGTAAPASGPTNTTSGVTASARTAAALTSSPLSSPSAASPTTSFTRRIPPSHSAPHPTGHSTLPSRASASTTTPTTTRTPLALNRSSSQLSSGSAATATTPTTNHSTTLTSRPSLNRSGSLLNDVAARRAALVNSLAPQPPSSTTTSTTGSASASIQAPAAAVRPPTSSTAAPTPGVLSSTAMPRPPSAGRHVMSRSGIVLHPTDDPGSHPSSQPIAGNMGNIAPAGSVIRVPMSTIDTPTNTTNTTSTSRTGTGTGALHGSSRYLTSSSSAGVRPQVSAALDGSRAVVGHIDDSDDDPDDLWFPGQAALVSGSGRLRAAIGTSSSSSRGAPATASTSRVTLGTALGSTANASGGTGSYSDLNISYPRVPSGSGGIGRFGGMGGVGGSSRVGQDSNGIGSSRVGQDSNGTSTSTSSRSGVTVTGAVGTSAPMSRPSQEGLRWRGNAPMPGGTAAGAPATQASGASTAGTSRSGSGGQLWEPDSDDSDNDEFLSGYPYRPVRVGGSGSAVQGVGGGALPVASASGVVLPGSTAYQERFMSRMAVRDQERQRLMANLRASQDELLRQAEDLQLAMAISMSLNEPTSQPARQAPAPPSAPTSAAHTPSLWPQQISATLSAPTAPTTSSSFRDASAVADAVINAARSTAAATPPIRSHLPLPITSTISTPALSTTSSGPNFVLNSTSTPSSSVTSGATSSTSTSTSQPYGAGHVAGDSTPTSGLFGSAAEAGGMGGRRMGATQGDMPSSLGSSVGGTMIAALLGSMAPRNPAAALLGEALFGPGGLGGGSGPGSPIAGGLSSFSPFLNAAMHSAAHGASVRGSGVAGDSSVMPGSVSDTEEDGSLRQPLLSRLQAGLRDLDQGSMGGMGQIVGGQGGGPAGRRGALLIRTAAADGSGSWFLGIPGPGGTIRTVRLGGAGGGGFQLGDFADGDMLSYDRLTQLEDVKVPTPKEVLDTLPETIYHRRSQGGGSMHKELFLEGPCSICMEEYTPGDKLTHLPCRHCFHTNCAKEWLGKFSKLCPVCKGAVTP